MDRMDRILSRPAVVLRRFDLSLVTRVCLVVGPRDVGLAGS